MAKGKALTHVDIRRALDLRSLGHPIKRVAAIMEVSPQTLYRILPKEYPEEYAEAIAIGGSMNADIGETAILNIAEDANHPRQLDAAKQLVNAYHPAYKQGQKLEITGSGGGPVQVEDRSASLAEVAKILETVGALRGITMASPALETGDAADS